MLRAAPGAEAARGLSHSIEKQTERPWAGGFVDVVTASAPTPEVTARLNLRGPPGIVSASRRRKGPGADVPSLVDGDKHEVAATPKNGRVGRLILDRPALRDPTADGTVEATLSLLAGDSFATAACQQHNQQRDQAESQDPEQHPDPGRGAVLGVGR